MNLSDAARFEALEEIQQAALLISAKTRYFLDGSPESENSRQEAILAYAYRLAEDEALVARITQAYQAKQVRNKDPLSILGSFGF